MFEFLRKAVGPIMIFVLVAFVCTIIFSWGGGGFNQQPTDTIGIVDGEDITFQQFDNYYSNLIRQEQQKTEDELTPEQYKRFRDQAWSQLVADHLMDREIDRNNLEVSSKEIFEYLRMYPPKEVQAMPAFATDGQFDYQKYLNAMANPEYASFWSQIENYVIGDLKKIKLQESVLSTVRVTPSEVMDAFLLDKETANIGYIQITNTAVEPLVAEPTEEELQTYYNEHKDDFKQDRRASLDMVLFKKDPSETDWNRTLAETQEIYDSIMAGADFAEMAMAYSEDNSAQRGGDLGYFERGRMVPPFDSTVFAMNIGDISQPVRTRFGFHIIQLNDIKTEDGVEKRKASHVLIKIETGPGTIDQLFQNAGNFAYDAKDIGFAEAAEKFNYEIVDAPKFIPNGVIAHIGRSPKVNNFVFAHKEGTISDVFDTENAYVVFKIREMLPEGYISFDDARRSIIGKIAKEKSVQLAVDSCQQMYDFLMAGNSFAKTASQFGVEYKQADNITRNGSIPGMGRIPEITGAAFAINNINGITKPIEYNRGAMILTLLDRKSPDLTEFNQKKDSLYYSVLQNKQRAAYNSWFENMVNHSDIVSYIDSFYTGN